MTAMHQHEACRGAGSREGRNLPKSRGSARTSVDIGGRRKRNPSRLSRRRLPRRSGELRRGGKEGARPRRRRRRRLEDGVGGEPGDSCRKAGETRRRRTKGCGCAVTLVRTRPRGRLSGTRGSTFRPTAMAAAVALLFGAGGVWWLMSLSSGEDSSRDRIAELQAELEETRTRLAAAQATIDGVSQQTAAGPEDAENVGRQPFETFRDCDDGCPEMVMIPAGKFMMGSPEDEEGR